MGILLLFVTILEKIGDKILFYFFEVYLSHTKAYVK